ncbi:MAG: hypothetical protein ACM3RP_00535 [Chitinophagales bacterium]
MSNSLQTLLAGLLAAEAAFLVNRSLLHALDEEARAGGRPLPGPGSLLVSAIPAVEEAAKDVVALLSGADLFGTHVVFGLAEAGFETIVGEGRGLVAGLFGLCGHALFGAATSWALARTTSAFLAAGAGLALHIAWNAVALKVGRRA